MSLTFSKKVLLTAAFTAVFSVAGCVGCTTGKKAGEIEAAPVTTQTPAEALMGMHIYFDFDKYNIRQDQVSTADAMASSIKTNFSNGTMIRIEGNCDERGSSEYNMALGQRRANALQQYLADSGVSRKQLTTTSYGKEKAQMNVAGRQGAEDIWAHDRRDDLVVLGQ